MKTHSFTREPEVETEGSVIHWGEWYDTLVGMLTLGQVRAVRERTIALANISTGEAILDVGCGTGELTRRARERTGAQGRAIGIDPAPEMIQVARRNAATARLEIDFRVGVVEALPFPDATFDVVLSSLMMHHLQGELKQAALTEIYRALKPRGRLVIVDLKRPTGRLGKMTAALMMHGGMKSGVQELAPLVEAVGLTNVETGALPFRMLGYLRAQKMAGNA